MKERKLLIWLTQLGLSAALPLAGFLILGIRLHTALGWGRWTIWAGLIFGITGAFRGFRESLRAMEKMAKDAQSSQQSPAVYNSHD